ncbi:MAG: NifU N-terminal domain-containing protein [Phycisphaerales bacterium JB050]
MMGYKIIRFESTPNPNAIKCILDAPISDRPKSFLNAAAADDDPLGSPFFELPGIRNILVNDNWISVNKLDETPWSTLKPALRRVVRDLPAPREGSSDG